MIKLPLQLPVSSRLVAPKSLLERQYLAPAKNDGSVRFNQILALGPHLAFSAAEGSGCFQERTGAAASTPAGDGDAVGSLRNFGSLGGWDVAPTDSARPIRRQANGRWFLLADGLDDVLQSTFDGVLANVSGWTLVLGVRNTAGAGNDRNFFSIMGTSQGVTRAVMGFNNVGKSVAGGRLNDTTSTISITGSNFDNTDVVLTSIGNYSDTDLFLRGNKVHQSSNLTWQTAGTTPNNGGHHNLFAWNRQSPTGLAQGRIYSALAFPTALSGADLELAETWTAQQMGLAI